MAKAFESVEKEKLPEKVRLVSAEGMSFWKILKSGLLRIHFQHSGVKIRVFEQNKDIIKFWLFY